jgi:hypothetical protein
VLAGVGVYSSGIACVEWPIVQASPFSDDHKLSSIDTVYSSSVANNIGAARRKRRDCSKVSMLKAPCF